jgi:hypothetical protein
VLGQKLAHGYSAQPDGLPRELDQLNQLKNDGVLARGLVAASRRQVLGLEYHS